jgi:nitrogen fixation/metabolism regulation signal transduction histidine kinase
MFEEQAHTKVLAWKSWAPDERSDVIWWVGAVRELAYEDQSYLVVGASALSPERLTEIASRCGARSLALGLALQALIAVPLPENWRVEGELPLVLDPGEPPSLPVLQSMRTRLLHLSILSFLLVLVLMPLLAHGLVRPLDELRSAVHRMESGEREIEFTARGPTEVRELANALRELSESLQSSEARMRSAERRAAWREMARRVAHEIKNALSPLTLAMDNVETAAQREDPAARRALASSLKTAREQLESLDRLVSEFRDFARTPRLNFQRTQALALAELALASVREQFPGLEFRIVEHAAVGVVSIDPEQMRRVMQNLLTNAAQAAPHAPIELALGAGPGSERWWFAVLDRGPGLPEEIASHWGEPYHTTKEGGTGLGLSIARQVVEGHQGVLSARKRPGGGLEIHADLPREASLSLEEDT